MAVSTKTPVRKRGEKDYLAIAKQRITRPSRLEQRHRFLFYSRNKKGKTKLCLSAPHVLMIDPEHGTDKFLKTDPYVWHITKWEDVEEVWGALRTGALSPAALDLGPEKESFGW